MRAARTDPSHYFVTQVQNSVKEIFGDAIISVSSAGTGPMYSFYEILKSPCISVGCTYIYSRIHSPNEFARLDYLNKTIKCITRLMQRSSITKKESFDKKVICRGLELMLETCKPQF